MACPDENTMIAFLHHRLSQKAAALVEDHLDQCSSCRRLLSLLAKASNSPGARNVANPIDTDDRARMGSPAPNWLSLPRGTAVDRYTVLDKCGVGGMGVVYAAYDPELDRRVALKFLHLQAEPTGSESGQRARIMREAQAMAKLSHPNVIGVYDVGTFQEQVFIAMEFVEGQTLKQWLTETPRRWSEVVRVFVAAGQGLAAAHQAGLVHRDFKPDNVLISQNGRVQVTDFGLARSHLLGSDLSTKQPETEAMQGPGQVHRPALAIPLTQTGELIGTPAYMAPEQILGQTTDFRTDQFGFGVALYEALYGERPFTGLDFETLSSEIFAGRVRPPPKETRVPSWLRLIVLRSLRADPAQRFPSMGDLLVNLARDPQRRRRRRWLSLGFASLVGVISCLVFFLVHNQQQVCGGAHQRMAGAWDEGREEEIRQTFVATGLPYAADSYQNIQRALTQYTREWIKIYTQACEATHALGEQSGELLDLRMQCLNRRLEELKALSDLLAHADKTGVEKSVEAVHALSDLTTCSDVAALTARVKPPVDPVTRDKSNALASQLAKIKALGWAGKYSEGVVKARLAVEESHSLGYRPLEAEALLSLADLQARSGDSKGAEPTFVSAAQAAIAGRDYAIAADCWGTLVRLTGVINARPGEGRQYARYAQAAIEGLGDNPQLQSQLEDNLGGVDVFEAKYDGAVAHFSNALALREKAFGPEDISVAHTLNNLADALAYQGKYHEELPLLQRSLAILENTLGPEHPDVAVTLSNLATLRQRQGQMGEAEKLFRRAIAIREKTLGPDHPATAVALGNLGLALTEQDQNVQALPILRRALAIKEKSMGSDHPSVAIALGNLGLLLMDLDQPEEALSLFNRSLSIKEKTLGPDHPGLAVALGNIAMVLSQQKRFKEARAYVERALSIRQKALGPAHPSFAESLERMADLFLDQNQAAQALSTYSKVQDIKQKALGLQHPELASSLLGQGKALLILHQAQEALKPLEAAVKLSEANPSHPKALAQSRFALARALWETKADRSRARQLAQAAKEQFLALGPSGQKKLSEVNAWLADKER